MDPVHETAQRILASLRLHEQAGLDDAAPDEAVEAEIYAETVNAVLEYEIGAVTKGELKAVLRAVPRVDPSEPVTEEQVDALAAAIARTFRTHFRDVAN